jgi:hypothetical protein
MVTKEKVNVAYGICDSREIVPFYLISCEAYKCHHWKRFGTIIENLRK